MRKDSTAEEGEAYTRGGRNWGCGITKPHIFILKTLASVFNLSLPPFPHMFPRFPPSLPPSFPSLTSDAVGRQFEALASVLPHLPSYSLSSLALFTRQLLQLFLLAKSPTYRALLVGFLETVDWPLLTAVAAEARRAPSSRPCSGALGKRGVEGERGSGGRGTGGGEDPVGRRAHFPTSDAPSISSPAPAVSTLASPSLLPSLPNLLRHLLNDESQADVQRRSLSLRLLGLLAHPTASPNLHLPSLLIDTSLPSLIPGIPSAACTALSTLARQHPPFLSRSLLPSLEAILLSDTHALDEAAKRPLLESCACLAASVFPLPPAHPPSLPPLEASPRPSDWVRARNLLLQALPRLHAPSTHITALSSLTALGRDRWLSPRRQKAEEGGLANREEGGEGNDEVLPILTALVDHVRTGLAVGPYVSEHASLCALRLLRALPPSLPPSLLQRPILTALLKRLFETPPLYNGSLLASYLRLLGALSLTTHPSTSSSPPSIAASILSALVADDLLVWILPSSSPPPVPLPPRAGREGGREGGRSLATSAQEEAMVRLVWTQALASTLVRVDAEG
ncbi:hypothetical protein Naga_100961g2, partial [Nannochloropsis gaditana]